MEAMTGAAVAALATLEVLKEEAPPSHTEAMGIESGRGAEVFLKDKRTISIVV